MQNLALAKEGVQAIKVIQRKQGWATHTGAYNENRGVHRKQGRRVQPKTRYRKQGRTTQNKLTQIGAYNERAYRSGCYGCGRTPPALEKVRPFEQKGVFLGLYIVYFKNFRAYPARLC